MGEFVDSSYSVHMNKKVSSENETYSYGFWLLNNLNIKQKYTSMHPHGR
jgi:hypothetical protein